MKRYILLILILLAAILSLSQTPEQFKYQAVLRDAKGKIIANQTKTVVIDILQGSAIGPSVFTETHVVTTTAEGIINLNIGSINTMGIGAIDWAHDIYFIKLSIGVTEMGTSQLLSVPYALNTKYAESADYENLLNKPILFDGNWTSIQGKPNTIAGYGIIDAFSGNYDDLYNKPIIDKSILSDSDNDTRILVEKYPNENVIHFEIAGMEKMTLTRNSLEFYNNSNTFVGLGTGYFNIAGDQNAFFGEYAGFNNSSGRMNTFLGYQSGKTNTIGSYNTFIGTEAGIANTYGHDNTYIGQYSGWRTTSGYLNTCIGVNSGQDIVTGTNNVIIGSLAGAYSNANNLTYVGSYSAYNNKTGTDNTYLGFQTGYSNINGSRNVLLGSNAGYFETGSDKLYISNSNNQNPLIYGDFYNNSLKINGKTTINDVLKLEPKSTAPSDPKEGEIYYDAIEHALKFYNGLQWISLSNCTDNPTNSIAGLNQDVSGNTATLAANNPLNGTGNWSIVSGLGGSFSNSSLPNTVFTGQENTSYVLRWTITSTCAASSSDVNINFGLCNLQPSKSIVGQTQYVNGLQTNLVANTPEIGQGCWTNNEGTAGFQNINLANTQVNVPVGGLYRFRWQITACQKESYSDLQVYFNNSTKGGNYYSNGYYVNTGPYESFIISYSKYIVGIEENILQNQFGKTFNIRINPDNSISYDSNEVFPTDGEPSTYNPITQKIYLNYEYDRANGTRRYVSEVLTKNGGPAKLATLSTSAASDITSTTAVCSVNIINDGDSYINDCGLCWNTTGNPTTADQRIGNFPSVEGVYTKTLKNLTPNTTYYVRAYAENTAGIVYGNEISFTTLP